MLGCSISPFIVSFSPSCYRVKERNEMVHSVNEIHFSKLDSMPASVTLCPSVFCTTQRCSIHVIRRELSTTFRSHQDSTRFSNLCCYANGASVEMALPHHGTTEYYEWCCREAELITSKQGSYNYIPTYKLHRNYNY